MLYDQCRSGTYGGYEDFQSRQVDLKAQVDLAKGACPTTRSSADRHAINATTCQQFVDGYYPPPANAAPAAPDRRRT